MPRGIIGRLLRYCNEQKITYKFEDKRVKLEPFKFTSSISLYNYQQEAVEAANKKDFGVIVAPPGAGKTVMGLEIVARKQQPALIIVHRRQLFDQWVDRVQSFLGIPKFQIGRIEGGNYEIGQEITVAMIQSLQTPGLSDKNKLYHALEEIEAIMRDIKQNGRQPFLEKERGNFSRVVHDYTDAKKGFVVWKGMLEEKVV
jgi:superfamily II DNA or RNA helicase